MSYNMAMRTGAYTDYDKTNIRPVC